MYDGIEVTAEPDPGEHRDHQSATTNCQHDTPSSGMVTRTARWFWRAHTESPLRVVPGHRLAANDPGAAFVNTRPLYGQVAILDHQPKRIDARLQGQVDALLLSS